jgi:hypothetical protein
MNNIEEYEASVTDLPFNWSSIDHNAIAIGWNKFWADTEITGFQRDKNGNYVRDAEGKLIAYRTDKQRQLPKCWFNNAHD